MKKVNLFCQVRIHCHRRLCKQHNRTLHITTTCLSISR